MTDTQPMAPTDAELDELRQANSGKLNFVTFSEFRTIARAVLAKWGSQPVVREPLTREQALEIVNKKTDVMMAIRLTEAAHGITGGKHVGKVD